MLLAREKIGSANFWENWKYLLKHHQSWTYSWCPSNSTPSSKNAHRRSPKTCVGQQHYASHSPRLGTMQTTIDHTIDFYKDHRTLLWTSEPILHKTTWRNLTEGWKCERSQTQESILCKKRQNWAPVGVEIRGEIPRERRLPEGVGVSAVLIKPCFLIWALLVTHVNSFCGNSFCCTFMAFSLSIDQ